MPPAPLRVALAQINPTVGDLAANEDLIAGAIAEAKARGAALVATPELAVCGYPPEDLLLNPAFLDACHAVVERLAATSAGITAVIGFPHRVGNAVFNAAAILRDRRWSETVHKIELPNYGVFDEKRYFTPGNEPGFVEVADRLIQISICEDAWIAGNVVRRAARERGARLAVNISASPFHAGKRAQRLAILGSFADEASCPVAWCNLVGGQDELVFDGGSLLLQPSQAEAATPRAPVAEATRFAADLLLVDLPSLPTAPPSASTPQGPVEEEEDRDEIRRALVLGTADYVRKNGFRHVVIGLSGGIDSALVAALAVEALGPGAVTGVTMPSRHSSSGTRSDAHVLADNLGIPCLEIGIDDLYQHFLDHLARPLGYADGATPGIEAENLQARIRGTILMTLSNRHGWLALTTGNKSELAMGYCTLYGDMAGGFAVLKDVAKTTVFALSRDVNRRADRDVIPTSIIERTPSAELRPDQRDEDSLPPYALLDAILERYVERDLAADVIAAETGADITLVRDILRKVDLNEYKRRQGPPGVRITPRNFGRDRRMPITNRWR